MTIEKINPGTSGLAQNLSVRSNIISRKLSILKQVQAKPCDKNQY